MSRNSPSKIDPEMLSELNFDSQFVQAHSTTRRQVKIEKGKSWRIRLLPAKLGPQKTWFARIAKHWLATKPIYCPRLTAPAFGGDPEAYCPVCDLSAQLHDSANSAEADLGYDVKGSPQWLTYCVVFEKDGVEQPMAEVLNPYEFWSYKGVWEDIKAFYTASGHKSRLSILDYKLGNDFAAIRTTKGLKLDKQDAMPIFDPAEPKYAEWIKKIEEGCKQPRVVMPKPEELDAFCVKIEDAVASLQRGSNPRRGRPSTGLEEGDEAVADNVEEPETPRRPLTRRPAFEAEEPDAEDEDQVPGAEVPAKPTRQPVAARTAAPVRKPAPVVEEEPEAEEPETEPVKPAARAAVRTAAPARKPVPVVEEEPETDADPDLGEQAEEPEPEPTPVKKAPVRTAAPVARRAPAPPPQPADEAEEDPLPLDETTDKAPPAPLEGEGDDEPAPAPPKVGHRGALGSAIKSKIDAVKNRGL